MLRRDFLALAGAAVLPSTLYGLSSERGDVAAQDAHSGFAPVNGLNLYYEIHGQGEPLIMIHGGVSAQRGVR